MFMLRQYRRILAQNHWCSEQEPLSKAQQEWLLHQGSLTQKLLQVTQYFNVEITQQKWIAKVSEKMTACRSDFWLREVLLKEKDQPWIFAQTVAPRETVEHVAQDLPKLGDQPIGLWLFPQKPKRISLEWQCDAHSGMYMRRACYLLKGYPLEISELFLADFPYL
ncbi:putative 4-hydroxybenzoate synthetase/chorismate--pyruvate lyase [Actinobacillus pleuropneumoniae]|uniref:4-hydroxybenzoate synthetase/chorismate--pyruvate lyase n=1 Tax=Actinobacillus pleuropneumoniae TaxID=715 RepID=A0A3S5BML0_ACTPL|nr:chorismate lyase [Actinobacillus pleuropneumoniae]EFL78651.1 4-hydroxybenzoate synthetase/chorismate--pyruvate lyase [Actinobacillus pleuropneumoniae serovar 2 str. 4226]EFM86799.1 4-hydroxybenzoate synthetase/chorismate--pyruvate lyase [Actinobacillus pleuropneumoniae serovar 2 str. S1536]KIE88448.1 putative 4-hydroxybenzoate synthetase/chorismate--pyruvate lyase [Actinobacillus pleuropneumoniae]KIE88479.1 putative 4-hydroxybenzoate synthetase/chorismate--pyruvate lyase [Actinobacillus pleu